MELESCLPLSGQEKTVVEVKKTEKMPSSIQTLLIVNLNKEHFLKEIYVMKKLNRAPLLNLKD